jgi:hypothetical protein
MLAIGRYSVKTATAQYMIQMYYVYFILLFYLADFSIKGCYCWYATPVVGICWFRRAIAPDTYPIVPRSWSVLRFWRGIARFAHRSLSPIIILKVIVQAAFSYTCHHHHFRDLPFAMQHLQYREAGFACSFICPFRIAFEGPAA